MSWTLRDDVLKAYCGALAHDLGKVWAQVPNRGTAPSRYNCQTPERHQVRFDDCESCKREYKYAHAPMGANLLSETIPAHGFLAEIAARHHSSEASSYGDLLRWATLGDQLSAGERDDRFDGPGGGRPVPALLNPLASGDVLIRPAPLHSTMLFECLDGPDPDGEARQAMGTVLDALREALERAGAASGDDLLLLSEHLTGAIYRGAMGVPSAFQNAVADIPLATHLHLAGAFAAALAADRSPVNDPEQASVGIVAGDLSGIQEFIHDTGSRRAARALRARSFYIQLLSVVAARWVAIQCGVPPWAAFSVVGGQFLVAIPASAVGRVPELQVELDRVLWEAHGSTLAIGLAAKSVTGRELKDFASVHGELKEALSVRKAQRYADLARSGRLFEPQPVLPMGRACRTCGREAIEGVQEDDDGVERRVCAVCDSLEKLGRQLLERSYVVLAPAGAPTTERGWQDVMAQLGHRVELHQAVPEKPAGAVIALDQDALDGYPCARYVPTARHAPRGNDGNLLDFEKIAAQGKGRAIIATLKADVDDLGQFLQGYFTSHPSSPSRFLAISTALSLFFEAYLPELAAKKYPNLYLVFSGGDDTALAGPLHDVLAFALDLRKRFDAWTAGNADLHFSAGVSGAHAHRPVQAGMEEAEAFLADAKQLVRPSHGMRKNAICALGVTMAWETFDRVWVWSEELERMVAGTGTSTSGRRLLARRALQHLQLLEAADPQRYGRLHWWSFYQLNRVARDYAEAESLLMDLRRQAFDRTGVGGRAVALAARLAEVATA